MTCSVCEPSVHADDKKNNVPRLAGRLTNFSTSLQGLAGNVDAWDDVGATPKKVATNRWGWARVGGEGVGKDKVVRIKCYLIT